jgi:hypothetical protein
MITIELVQGIGDIFHAALTGHRDREGGLIDVSSGRIYNVVYPWFRADQRTWKGSIMVDGRRDGLINQQRNGVWQEKISILKGRK